MASLWCADQGNDRPQPERGPFPCGGLVTIHSQAKEITRSGQYWAFAHFSRVIHRGAHRFDSQGMLPGVEHVAFENPGGQRVLVVTNTGPDRPATLSIADWETRISLDKDSVMSLVWS